MVSFLKTHSIIGLIFSLFLVTNVGGFMSADIMIKDGMLTPCPFMGVASLCNMTPLEHVSQWQQMFTTTSQEFASTALLLLLSLVVVFTVVNFLSKHKLAPIRPVSRYRYRERVFDSLKLAFARGILNPKLY